jgi:uncharacterized protein YndB with AHSA1/START domain
VTPPAPLPLAAHRPLRTHPPHPDGPNHLDVPVEGPFMAKQRQISTSRVIAADRQAIFDVIADPAMHPVIDGSGTVREARVGGPERLEKGATFGMDMKVGTSYKITNTVVEFDEGERIAWRHFHGHRWRYEFADVDGGTEVTETFDWSRAKAPLALELARYPKRNLKGMKATLERLDRLMTSGTVDDAA